MITLDVTHLESLLTQYFLPWLRILALFSTAPFFNEQVIPRRVKVVLALFIAILLTPSLPKVQIDLLSVVGAWTAVKQILLGSSIGIALQVVFSAINLAGEIIGLQMGISFATFFDANTDSNNPIVAQLLNVFITLIFLSLNGHLWMIAALASSFYSLPISDAPLHAQGFVQIADLGTLIFANALLFGLPIITLLLIVNISLGILNRLIPQFSVFAVGFSFSLLMGLVAITLLSYTLAPFSQHLLTQVFDKLSFAMNRF